MDIENINSNLSNPAMQEDEHIEQLLSEKLMEGYVLLEKSCPVCTTPLVKNVGDEDEDEGVHKEIEHVMIPKGSFLQPFSPVEGVPLCVACTSHVVTQDNEIKILEKCGSLKAKGGVLVASAPSSSKKVEPEIIDVTDAAEAPEIIDVTQVEEEVQHSDEKKEEDSVADSLMVEYSVRREIATKVLGAKMLQGYSLLEKQCEKCGMPTMEHEGNVECVVCPVLLKKAKKKMKAQKKLEKESTRLEAHISMAKASKQAKDIQAATVEDQKRHEEAVRREKERVEREIAERQLQILREKEAEQTRKLEFLEEERSRMSAMEAEQARLVLEAKYEQELEAHKLANQAAAKAQQAKEEQMKFEEVRKMKAMTMEEEHAAAQQKRKEIELKIEEDAKRLEEMEQRRKDGLATALENMNRDVLVAENRRRLQAKAALDLQISRLEENIQDEELETKTIGTAKRAEDDERMIAVLEQEAAEKAKAAEEAIRKAKAALEHVNSARREIIAQTIALAEQEVIAETEETIKKEREGYKAPVLLPSASEIANEQWETLRTEGRAIMTRRVMGGWVLLAEFCSGAECHSSPLITKDAKKECVVCGGCGSGKDGAYTKADDYDVVPADGEVENARETGINTGYEITSSFSAKPLSPAANHSAAEIQQDFETKRNMVSKEIGKRMIQGWTLLDASCPTCVMPLMMDTAGNTNVCVLCGIVDTMKETDGMTIKTEDVPTKTVPVPVPVPSVAKPVPTEKPAEQLANALESMTVASQAQTKPYTDDAETMYTTIASAKEESSLVDSIRQNAQRQNATPRSDPPPSTKAGIEKETVKPMLDPEQITSNLSDKSSEGLEITQVVSASTLSAMIMNNTTGAELAPSMSKDEVKEAVEGYVEKNLNTTVSDEMKEEVAIEIQRKLSGDDVIHVEDVGSPRAFNFDMVGSDDYSNGRQPPTPENASRSRTGGTSPSRRGMPPRPDSSSRSSPRRLPRTPKSSSPRHGGFVITGGPSDVTSLGEVSRVSSVATDALDSILDRIDAAKATLLRDDVTVQEQLQAANLIEKLAQAAVAVKALEKMDM